MKHHRTLLKNALLVDFTLVTIHGTLDYSEINFSVVEGLWRN